MTDHAVRPARQRDLVQLDLDERRGARFVMVAGDPPVGHLRVDLLDGHAHLAALVVGADLDGSTAHALVESACERLAARGHGQLTARPYAGTEAATYTALGFVEIPADEPLPGPLARMPAAPGHVLVRRVLRTHRTTTELSSFLPELDTAPRDVGTLRAVVRRPAPGAREVLDVGHLDVTEGLVGDTWVERGSRRMPDGSPHPDMQLNLMNHRLVEFLAQDPAREQLAGDQMFVDLDLSHDAAAAGMLLGALLNPDRARKSADALGDGVVRHGGPLTHPLTVALLRSLVLSVDDFAAGMLRAPPGLARLLGEDGADLAGRTGSAAILVAVATRFGLLRDGAVEVRESRRASTVAAPTGFRDRADRIPTGRSQIRIERYSSPASPDRFEVFVGGTRAAGLLGGDEPWDMTSNLHGVAELSPGSLRAVEEAMHRSGMTAHSEVVFTGYSQGGLLATQLAASGEWNTQGLVTFGAPVGHGEVPDDFPVVHVAHTDDLVPAFGGDRTDLSPLVVRREAFAGREVPDDVPVPAHRLAEYRTTAELLDGARSPALVAAAGRLRSFSAGAERSEVILYRADRVAVE